MAVAGHTHLHVLFLCADSVVVLVDHITTVSKVSHEVSILREDRHITTPSVDHTHLLLDTPTLISLLSHFAKLTSIEGPAMTTVTIATIASSW